MLPLILEHMKNLGHVVFDHGDFDLNIFGIRCNLNYNAFDDLLGCAYLEDGHWKVEYWPATTDPGHYHLENPQNVKGTAILVPGQYRGVWALDLHRKQYTALCQRNGPVRVYRDANRDTILDLNSNEITEGFYGINIHKAGKVSTQVDRWSAGCQVFAREADFQRLLKLCRTQIALRGWDKFTYTLIDKRDLNNLRF